MRLSCRFLLSRSYGLKRRIICQEGSTVLQTNVPYTAWHVTAARRFKLQGLVLEKSEQLANRELEITLQCYPATNGSEDV